MKIKSYFVNILDFLILFLLFTMLICFLFDKNNQQIKMIFNKSTDVAIVVDINDENVTADTFTHGEKLYLESTELLGTVENSVDLKNKIYFPSDNTLVFEYGSNVIGARVTLNSKIKENKEGKFVNGAEFITVGQNITIFTEDDGVIEGVIYDIRT